MSPLICTICIECLETKIAVSTTCGHILCSECATRQFTIRPTCPVCRREQTFEQLIHLFPEYGQSSESEASSDAAPSSSSTQQQIQIQIPKMPYPQPSQNPPPSPLSPTSSRITTQTVATRRIWLDVTGTRFPWTLAGPVPACGRDGSPVFLGLAAFKEGLHPCKICVEPQGRPVPYVSYGGEEHAHEGTTLLLPSTPWRWSGCSRATGRSPRGGGLWRAGTSGSGRRCCTMRARSSRGSLCLGRLVRTDTCAGRTCRTAAKSILSNPDTKFYVGAIEG